jgi:hypothetical protein
MALLIPILGIFVVIGVVRIQEERARSCLPGWVLVPSSWPRSVWSMTCNGAVRGNDRCHSRTNRRR